jgi:hypothetical protein
MPTFLEQHADKILGTLSCFDRVIIRGYLPLEDGGHMAQFMRLKGVKRETLSQAVGRRGTCTSGSFSANARPTVRRSVPRSNSALSRRLHRSPEDRHHDLPDHAPALGQVEGSQYIGSRRNWPAGR